MKFIEERQLRDAFWKIYSRRTNILSHQFECQARHGGIDLITIEKVSINNKDVIQFCAYEFKLDDIKKALAQAELNLQFCHKSYIVIPVDKEKIINERYTEWIKNKKYIGVIGVALDGRWNIIIKPWTQLDDKVTLNQEILKICCNVL